MVTTTQICFLSWSAGLRRASASNSLRWQSPCSSTNSAVRRICPRARGILWGERALSLSKDKVFIAGQLESATLQPQNVSLLRRMFFYSQLPIPNIPTFLLPFSPLPTSQLRNSLLRYFPTPYYPHPIPHSLFPIPSSLWCRQHCHCHLHCGWQFLLKTWFAWLTNIFIYFLWH